MAKKNKKNRKGCLIALLILIGALLVYNSVLTKTAKENKHRTFIAVTLRDGVEKYFSKHKHYPENVSALDITYKNTIEEFLRTGILEYSRDPSGSQWFTVTCRFSGILSRGGNSPAFSWSGIQYSNDVNKLSLPAGEHPAADKNGFFQADFH